MQKCRIKMNQHIMKHWDSEHLPTYSMRSTCLRLHAQSGGPLRASASHSFLHISQQPMCEVVERSKMSKQAMMFSRNLGYYLGILGIYYGSSQKMLQSNY